jgi:putative addiction module antidote
MSQTLTIRQEGESLAIPIPPEVAEFLKVSAGDKLYVVKTEEGFALTSDDLGLDDDDRAMLRAYAEIREQYDETLRRLAQ